MKLSIEVDARLLLQNLTKGQHEAMDPRLTAAIMDGLAEFFHAADEIASMADSLGLHPHPLEFTSEPRRKKS